MPESPAYPHSTCSTTEASRKLPGLLQEIYGNKGIVVVGRQDRVLGAIVSYEAVKLLAGEMIDPSIELRIRNAAKNLLQE